MRRKRIISVVISLALVILLGGELLLSLFAVNVSAAGFYKETGVIEDLKKDSTFNESDYPAIDDNYSLKVIQLTEGETGNIYIYVYQPSANSKTITASSVNISNTGTAVGLATKKLTLVSKEGVFHKYKVEGLSRLNTFERKYFVVSILRPFSKDLGDTTTNDVTVGVEKAYPVETIWTATTALDGSVKYDAAYSEDTITFTSQLVDYIYYDQSTLFDVISIKSYYLAFSTNKPVDSILEATIEYSYNYTYEDVEMGIDTHKTVEKARKTLTSEQIFEINNTNFFQEDYEYKRIHSVDAFLKCKEIDFSDDVKTALKKEQWVLRFLETSYTYNAYPWRLLDTDVTSVSAVSLKYKYKDKIFNVGVIADTVTDDDIEGGYVEEQEWWQKIMAVLMFIVFLIFVWPLVSLLITILLLLLWDGVKFLIRFCIKGILWILTLPFRIIGWFLK